MSDLKNFRTPEGKRLRSPEEFIRAQGDDPVCKVKTYNRRDQIVIEAWKNMRTKATHILKCRRPTDAEEKQLGSMIVREQIMGKANQDQVEIVIAGDKYEKKELKSQ